MPSLYDVSTVHVSITDDNDNRPIITHPESQLDNDTATIELTSSVLVGHVVTRVRASDADVGDNAKLSYSIVSDVIASDVVVGDVMTGDVMTSDVIASDVMISDVISGDVITSDVIVSDVIASDVIASDVNGNVELFAIDSESGEVTVASSLPHNSQPVTYHVDVEVRDAGTPSLAAQTTLHIVVSDTPSTDVDVISRRSALSTTSSLIDVTWWLIAVAGCVLAGLLVIAFTSCLLVCVNRRRRRKRHARTNTATSTTMTPRTASLSRRQVQAPAPLSLMTDVGPSIASNSESFQTSGSGTSTTGPDD